MQTSIGNDPVKANAMWVGGDYLDVSFMFNYGGHANPHAINLVNNQLEPGERFENDLNLESGTTRTIATLQSCTRDSSVSI